MTLEFSELVLYAAYPRESANKLKESLGWDEIESFQDSWVLLGTPGGGKVGYMQYNAADGSPLPAPNFAMKSTAIEADVAELRASGISVEDVKKSDSMWHSTFTDADGNKFLIWQTPE